MEQNKTLHQRVFTTVAVCAIVYSFFHQAQLMMKPIPLAFKSTDIAWGYNLDTFSGTVYHDKGVTAIRAGTGVALHVNGSATATTTTNASGVFTFTNIEVVANDVVTIFVDNNAALDAVRVVKFDAATLTDDSVTDMDLYKDVLIIGAALNAGSTTGDNITTTNLNLADNAGDADVTAIYSLTNANRDLQMGYGKELLVHAEASHTASGAIYTHDLDVRGSLNAGTGTIFASGSVVAVGNFTALTALSLTAKNSGELINVAGAIPGDVYIDSGLETYFRFDEGAGLNASGSMLTTASGGSLTNGAAWVQTNTGTTLFYNPYAIEFDDTNDYIEFNSSFNLKLLDFKTFAGWFRRKGTGTTDVILGNTTSSGTLLAGRGGYSIWVNPSTNKINASLFDTGGSVTTVVSETALTDQNWHHFAVSIDTSTAGSPKIGFFLDGAMDGFTTGSLGTTAGFISTKPFTVGALSSSGTGVFDGTIDDVRIYNRVLSGGELSVIATGNKSTGSGTYYLSGAINIDGDLGIYGGTLDVGTKTLRVAGDINAFGELRTNSGIVILDGTAQILRGSTAFNQLSKSVTSTTTLSFESNTEQTVSGAITLQGTTNNRLSLRATVVGDQAFLIVESSGATILKNLNIKDNNALTGALMSCTSGCIDNGNNINWAFLGECGDGVVNTGEACDDGNTNNLDSCPNDCALAACGDSVIEGLEECDPPNTGFCQSNCLFRGAGGGGGGRNRSSSASTASFFQRPEPPDGCGNAVLETEKGEECDTGTRFNGMGTCSFGCKLLTCGDGVINPQNGEDCEPKKGALQNGIQQFEVATCGEICTAAVTTAEGTLWGGCKRIFLQPCEVEGSSSSSSSIKASKCGNGIVDRGEECDFGGICEGGDFAGSFWTDKTSATTCENGGGIPSPVGGDGCSGTCTTEYCGDGSVQVRGADNQPQTEDDEQCDNGSVCSNDSLKVCRLDNDCGTGNTCEYHLVKDRKCSDKCKNSTSASKPKPSAPSTPTAQCGNGKVEGPEQCDEGTQNGIGDSTCTTTCTKRIVDRSTTPTNAVCGNAVVEKDEECDSGDNNSDILSNACRTNCVKPTCGDFVIDQNEKCDSGDANSDFYSDTCRYDCTLPTCGDGVVDSDEECDSSWSCLPNCRLAMQPSRCGNGKVETAEQCDDGNIASGDGCSRFCQKEEPTVSKSICGNGVTEVGEQCDDGNLADEDGCSSGCMIKELVIRKAAAAELQLDADVVVVNPTEIATALKFIVGNDPCSTLVIKGQNQKASLIRAAALEQKIPIVRNIDLARAIYKSVRPGEIINGELCDEVNKLKVQKKQVPAKPSAPIIQPSMPQLPQAPTQFAYGYYPYAQVTPMITQHQPVGETGPAVVGVIVAGAAGGMGWMRIRRKRML